MLPGDEDSPLFGEIDLILPQPQNTSPLFEEFKPAQPIGPQGERPSIGGEFVSGVRSGVMQVGSDLRAAGAVASSIFGMDESAFELIRAAQEISDDAERSFPKTIAKVEDIESFNDFLRWASRSLGEQVPILATTILSGGAGGVIGNLVGRGALTLGASSQLIAKFPALGTGIGLFAGTSTLETGNTASELFKATGDLNPEVSLAAGMAKGALEMVVPMALASRLGISPAHLGGIFQRANAMLPRGRLGAGLGAAGLEGVTESLQEIVDLAARRYVDANFDVLGPEAISRILNAAASGALVGGVLGAAAHTRGKVQEQKDTQTQITELLAETRESNDRTVSSMQPLTLADTPDALPKLQEARGWEQAETFTPQDNLTPESLLKSIPEEKRGPNIGTYDESILAQDLDAIQTYAHKYWKGKDSRGEISGPAKLYNSANLEEYSLDTHVPGTAQWLTTGEPMTKDVIELRAKLTKFFSNELQRLGLGDHKLIITDTLSRTHEVDLPSKLMAFPKVWQPREGALGHYAGFGDRVSLIALDMQSLEGRSQVYSVAAHEFGHLLVHRRLADSSPQMKSRLQAAYNNALLKAVNGDMRDVRKGFFALRDLDYADATPTAEAFTRENAGYWLSFDEWAAEQIARFYYGKADALSDVDHFFKRIADALYEMFKQMKQLFRFDADIAIQEWVDSLAQNPQPISQGVFTRAAKTAPEENRATLTPTNNGESIPPPQAAMAGVDRVLGKLGVPMKQRKEIRGFADKFNWFMNLMFNLQQIALANPHLKSLARYVELVDEWYSFQMQWVGRANTRVKEWMSLGKSQTQAVAKLLFAIDQMEYLTPAERKAGTARFPTDAEMIALTKKYGVNEVGLAHYYKVREDFLAVLAQIEKTTIRDITRTIKDPALLASNIARVQAEFNAMRAKPYFPHARFGTIAVVVKRGKTTMHMEQFMSMRDARAASQELSKEFAGDQVNIVQVPQEIRMFQGIPSSLLASIRNNLQLTEIQSRWLDDLVVEQAPSASFRRRLARRMDTPGFSLDAMRAYATYFFSASKHLARIEYGPLMQEEIHSFSGEISAAGKAGEITDVRKRGQIRDYMQNHHTHIMNPKPDWAQLRSAAFLYYLGFNVSSAALNFTQPILVGLPYLSARFSDGQAMSAMMKATRDLQDMYKWKEQDRVSDTMYKLIARGMEEGVVDESQSAELAGMAHTEYLSRLMPGTTMQRLYMRFQHYGSYLFTASEKINRRIMFRAGAELALKNLNSPYLKELAEQNQRAIADMLDKDFSYGEALAYLAAKDVVRRTQFQYAEHARPKFMRGKKGVLFTFFMFKQMMLHFALYAPGNTRYLVMMLFMAGLMGLPGAEDLEALAKMFARTFLGSDFDVQREVRKLVTGMLGDEIPPDLFLFGAGRVGFGLPAALDLLGLPKANFDFSRRIGMGRILPGVAELGTPGLDFDHAMSRVTTDAAGAAFGIGINMIRALTDDQLPIDDFKRWERAMPTAVSNLTKAVRYGTEGKERSRTGAEVVSFDVTDPDHIIELALRGLGFMPTRVSREWSRVQAQREVEAYWGGRRALILRLYGHSFATHDLDLRSQVMQDLRRYNEDVPFGIMRITGETLEKSRKEKERSRKLQEAGIPRQKMYRPLAHETNALFPEAGKGSKIRPGALPEGDDGVSVEDADNYR